MSLQYTYHADVGIESSLFLCVEGGIQQLQFRQYQDSKRPCLKRMAKRELLSWGDVRVGEKGFKIPGAFGPRHKAFHFKGHDTSAFCFKYKYGRVILRVLMEA